MDSVYCPTVGAFPAQDLRRVSRTFARPSKAAFKKTNSLQGPKFTLKIRLNLNGSRIADPVTNPYRDQFKWTRIRYECRDLVDSGFCLSSQIMPRRPLL